jgi:hypothetical protein
MLRNLLLSTVLLATPASAGLVNWDLPGPQGNLGDTHNFLAAGIILRAAGFASIGGPGAALFANDRGPGETGLGLADDPSHNDEISGRNFVQLDVSGPLASRVGQFKFSMESSTQGEQWSVFGATGNDGSGLTPLFTKFSDEATHTLPGGFKFYDFFYSGPPIGECGRGCNANVLLGSFSGVQAIPEPSTWAMLILGFAGLAYASLRRRSKAPMVSAI